jgi:hypothetical protein
MALIYPATTKPFLIIQIIITGVPTEITIHIQVRPDTGHLITQTRLIITVREISYTQARKEDNITLIVMGIKYMFQNGEDGKYSSVIA